MVRTKLYLVKMNLSSLTAKDFILLIFKRCATQICFFARLLLDGQDPITICLLCKCHPLVILLQITNLVAAVGYLETAVTA